MIVTMVLYRYSIFNCVWNENAVITVTFVTSPRLVLPCSLGKRYTSVKEMGANSIQIDPSGKPKRKADPMLAVKTYRESSSSVSEPTSALGSGSGSAALLVGSAARNWSPEALEEAERNGDFVGSHCEGDFGA